MFKNLKISAKLVIVMMVAGLLPLSIVGYIAFRSSSEALEAQAKNQLVSIRDIKKAQIETYFSERKGDMGVLIETVKTLREEAFKKLVAIRQIKKGQIESYFAQRKTDIGTLVETVKILRDEAFKKLGAVQAIKKGQIESYFAERKGDMGVLVETVKTLREEAFKKLMAIRAIKKSEIETYFAERRSDVKVLATSETVTRALLALSRNKGAPAKSGRRAATRGRVASQTADALLGQNTAWLDQYKKEYGYYDLFLITRDGHVGYTVAKESDLGQNLATGSLKDSPLGKCFKNSLDGIALQDFEPYAPSGGVPAAFIGAPVKQDGRIIGVVALQFPLEAINNIMQERSGMGKTGEVYLVGPDKLMRSDSFLDPKGHSVEASFAGTVEKNGCDTEASRDALSGNVEQKVIIDYNGNLVLSAYAPLKIEGLNWAILAEIDVEEALCPKIEGETTDYFTKYKQQYGYYDLFLINPDGYCFYSVTKEKDYKSNFLTGEYRESGLGKLIRRVLQTKGYGLADFEPYAPSNNEVAAFCAQPVMDKGEVQVVVALQMPLDAINAIMQEREGMGKTGETYLVGPDKRMRSDSYLDPKGHSVQASFAGTVEKNGCDTEASEEALAGRSGAKVIFDYNNNPVLSAYAPLKIEGVNWAIIAEIDVEEAFCPKVKGAAADFFTTYKQLAGYYDIFLINPDGYCFYTVARESDYKTNFLTGQYKDSGLGKLVRKVLQTKQYGVADFEPYAPSNDEASAFCAQPVLSQGKVEAVVAVQIPMEIINRIMQERSGMGKTGETYLVGSDKRMRSDSFLDPQGHSVKASFAGTIEKNGCDTEAAREALSSNTGQKVIKDYNGNPVLSAYAPIDIEGITWAIIAEIDVEEAFCPKIEGEADDYFTKYKQQYGYYDLFLMNPDGYCFYSVAKESDYQTNFVNGRFRDSGLGKLVRKVLQSKTYGLADFEPYAPSNDEPAAFTAQTVLGTGGEVEAIVALQLPLSGINNIMQQRSGMGKTGETYLVGSDYLMRSDSYLNKQTHSVMASFKNQTKAETEGSKAALAGKTDVKLIDDYRGAPVYSAYCPVKVEDTQWALLAEIDEAEALAPVTSLRNTIVTIGIIIGALVALGGFLMARSISTPLTRVVERLREIAEGRADLTQKIEATSNDEIGQLGQSFNQLADTMNEFSMIAQKIADGDLTVKVTPKGERDVLGLAFAAMVSNLENMVGQIISTSEQVGAASGEVSTTAQQSASGAQQQLKGVEQISSQTTQVSSQMEEVSSQIEEMASGIEQASATVDSQLEFVQRVSATMEEMAASVDAVSENATKAQDQGKGAVSEAQKGQEAVQAATRGMDEISSTIGGLAKVIGSLGQRSNQIGNIVDTITGIASQTNLLALNAAIEAARAGEHGRGFAVVADEVRKLAERTAQATEEIETLVKGIQDESQNAVKSTEDGIEKVKQGDELTRNVGKVLDVIVGSIRETSDAVQGILASTEEQSKAAKDVAGAVEELTGMSKQIAKGMSEQSKGAQQISQAVAQTSKAMEETSASIQEVSGVTNQVAAGAQEMASSAEELSAQAEGLQELMSQFTLSNGGEKAAARGTARAPRRPAREQGARATGKVWQTAGRERAGRLALGSEEEKLKPKLNFGPKAGGNGGDGR